MYWNFVVLLFREMGRGLPGGLGGAEGNVSFS